MSDPSTSECENTQWQTLSLCAVSTFHTPVVSGVKLLLRCHPLLWNNGLYIVTNKSWLSHAFVFYASMKARAGEGKNCCVFRGLHAI